MNHAEDFFKLIRHPLKFRFFLFTKLPAAFFSGVRVREVNEEKCRVTIPYKWFTQNPFRSTYFASMSMAAEMSTGVLAMAHIYKRNPPVSMLVIKMEASYFKKAADKTSFLCLDGEKIKTAVEEAIQKNESVSVTAKSTGTNRAGEVVAEFYITWSFKAKNK